MYLPIHWDITTVTMRRLILKLHPPTPVTNKLRGVLPITRDTLYNGVINSNTKLYRDITVAGTARPQSGTPAALRATRDITLQNNFEAEEGMDFAAYIPEDGPFVYDAVGNLIADEEEGSKISWTAYGKVRDVKTRNDSVVVRFKYDATGNRIEKRVEKYDTTLITRYVRDASGNVMGIYNDTTVMELPIYGSSRAGVYRSEVLEGDQTLGRRSYELSNHLGNVLNVITDNIGMTEGDSTWAYVTSTSDYYPFGLDMAERSWKDTATLALRYGFNGKERGTSEEWGTTNYDYGFRIYNPLIGKFLSTDPLTRSFSWNSPYAYAENDVIRCVDLDGLEKVVYLIYVDHGDGTVYKTKIELKDAGKLGKGVAVLVNVCNKEKEVELYLYGSDKQNLTNYIVSYEDNVLHVYHGQKDKPGVLTVGVGHKVSGSNEEQYFTEGCFIDEQEGKDLFEKDLPKIIGSVEKQVGEEWQDLSQNKKDALTDMGYNKGPAHMSKYNESSYFFFSFYNNHGIERSSGILKRRAAEFILHEDGGYFHFDIQKKKGVEIIKQIINDFYKPSSTGTDTKTNTNTNTPNSLSPTGSGTP